MCSDREQTFHERTSRLISIDAKLKQATDILMKSSGTARLDAEILMAHALGMDRSEMLLQRADLIVPDSYDVLVKRRAHCEPIAYIVGQQDFWDLTLFVDENVLIPRADSETLIEQASLLCTDQAPSRILDLGTGSGALLLAALSVFPDAVGVGIDQSQAALEIARKNAVFNGLDRRCTFIHANWHDQSWDERIFPKYDLILCNPPYIRSDEVLMVDVTRYEPHDALFAGVKGLDDYAMLIPKLKDLIQKNGVVIFEIGYDQAQEVGKIAQEEGCDFFIKQDLAGIDRVIVMKHKAL